MGDEQVLYNYSFVDSESGFGIVYARQSAAKTLIGFNALINNGYSAIHPPADFAGALAQVNHDFVSYCCMLLCNAGIPSTRIYTHIAAAAGYAGTPALQFSNAPLSTAFNDYSTPGFTTYVTGDPSDLSLIYSELAAQKCGHWASTEANPYFGGGVSPESYIRMHFDHGATVMVLNIGATSAVLSNNLYQGAYGAEAIRAYYSFLTN